MPENIKTNNIKDLVVCLSVTGTYLTNTKNSFKYTGSEMNAVVYKITSLENTAMNENISGGCLLGSLYNIPIPKVINGVEKSITDCLSAVIVKSHIPNSAL